MKRLARVLVCGTVLLASVGCGQSSKSVPIGGPGTEEESKAAIENAKATRRPPSGRVPPPGGPGALRAQQTQGQEAPAEKSGQ